MLVEEDFVFGGSLNNETLTISDMPAQDWVNLLSKELNKLTNVKLMKKTELWDV